MALLGGSMDVPLVETIEDREVREFTASFAMTLHELADAARETGRADIALLAEDASATVFALLDLLARHPIGPRPTRD